MCYVNSNVYDLFCFFRDIHHRVDAMYSMATHFLFFMHKQQSICSYVFSDIQSI